MSQPVSSSKSTLRELMRQRRSLIDASTRAQASWMAATILRERWPRLVPIHVAQPCVGLYHQIGAEFSCAGLADMFTADGIACALPRIEGTRAMSFRRWKSGDSLEIGAHRIPCPSAASAVCEPQVLILPALAVDRHGNRLGYGGGYYDSHLASVRARPLTIALVFDLQVVDLLPTDSWDQRVDAVLTESRWIEPCEAAWPTG